MRTFPVGKGPTETIAKSVPLSPLFRDDRTPQGVTVHERWEAVLRTERLAEAGSYVAQVRASRGQGEVPEVLDERVVYVLDKDDYDVCWRRLFGETWDEPVLCDSTDEAQGEELVRGLAGDALFEPPLDEVAWDGRSIHRHLGAIVAACMVEDLGPLPFEVWRNLDVRTYTPPQRLPHVDLTKLTWLLRVLAPAWADACFFSPSLNIDCEAVGEDAVKINFRPVTVKGVRIPATGELRMGSRYSVPRLDGLVKEAIGREHRLSLEWPVEGPHYSLTYAQERQLNGPLPPRMMSSYRGKS